MIRGRDGEIAKGLREIDGDVRSLLVKQTELIEGRRITEISGLTVKRKSLINVTFDALSFNKQLGKFGDRWRHLVGSGALCKPRHTL